MMFKFQPSRAKTWTSSMLFYIQFAALVLLTKSAVLEEDWRPGNLHFDGSTQDCSMYPCGTNLDKVNICRDPKGKAETKCVKPEDVVKYIEYGDSCGRCPTQCFDYPCGRSNKGDKVYVCKVSKSGKSKTECLKSAAKAIGKNRDSYCGQCEPPPLPTETPTAFPSESPTGSPTARPTLDPLLQAVLDDPEQMVVLEETEKSVSLEVLPKELFATLTTDSITFETQQGTAYKYDLAPTSVYNRKARKLAAFWLYQAYPEVRVVRSRRRRLNNPGCDRWPDSTCSLGCCAVHDQCYDINGCTAASWTSDQGGQACDQCNSDVVDCINNDCPPERCYDDVCDVFFDCPGTCNFWSWSDQACCGCQAEGDACRTPPPTDPPITPTDPPIAPTDPPIAPTDPPIAPTDPPIAPTDPPIAPTDPPIAPTDPPITPTDPPIAPTDPPAPPTDPPAPGPPSPTGGGRRSGVFGDPHLSTFDRLRFDCQAAGIFTMVKSLEDSSFMIQEHFTAVGSDVCSQASVSTGIAIKEDGLPRIQVSVPRGNSSGADLLPNGCPIDFYVDGNLTSLSSGSGDPNADLFVSSNDIRVVYPLTGLQVRASVRNSGSFGCFFLIQIFLPFDYRMDETIIGLLGKPNGIRSDDWVDPDGNSYSPPEDQEQSIFSEAYNYCVNNWCVRNESESIFSFRAGETFDNADDCDETYADEIETAIHNASPELQAICHDDLFCFVDGICGAPEDAEAALDDAETVEAAQEEAAPLPSSSPSFSPVPSGIPSTMPSASQVPSFSPSSLPSGLPSAVPSVSPSTVPSRMPSVTPSFSAVPSSSPSAAPTRMPSVMPSSLPSSVPSGIPSVMPSSSPSVVPSGVPSTAPSSSPSTEPSAAPSRAPSSSPSSIPSGMPSTMPTVQKSKSKGKNNRQ